MLKSIIYFAQILCSEASKTSDCQPINLPVVAGDVSNLKIILRIVFSIIALVSVIFVAYGGFKYVTSAGDSNNVAKAKNTIMYSIIGLVISLSAFIIVSFVIGKV